MTVTASATTGSTVELGTITNTFGTITANVSGTGTTSSDALTADDVTLSITAGGGIYDAVTATDDIVITAANTAALTFTSLDAGSTSTGLITITATGSKALEISDVVTSAGKLTISGADATGDIRLLSADNYTGVVSMTGGSGNDSVISGSGSDVISTGAGVDSINSGAGNDSINAYRGTSFGNDGDDTLFAYWDADVYGGSGQDLIDISGTGTAYGGGGGDEMITTFRGIGHGDGGNDTILAGGEAWGDEGDDLFQIELTSETITKRMQVQRTSKGNIFEEF
jgi:hypothetical protein